MDRRATCPGGAQLCVYGDSKKVVDIWASATAKDIVLMRTILSLGMSGPDPRWVGWTEALHDAVSG